MSDRDSQDFLYWPFLGLPSCLYPSLFIPLFYHKYTYVTGMCVRVSISHSLLPSFYPPPYCSISLFLDAFFLQTSAVPYYSLSLFLSLSLSHSPSVCLTLFILSHTSAPPEKHQTCMCKILIFFFIVA